MVIALDICLANIGSYAVCVVTTGYWSSRWRRIAVFCFNPLRHILSTFVRMMPQHAADKVIGSECRQVQLAITQLFDQRLTMHCPLVALAEQGVCRQLARLPLRFILIEANGLVGQLGRRKRDGTGPRLTGMHALRSNGGGDTRCAAQHGVNQFALYTGAEAQRGQANPCGGHNLQRVFGPVHHMKALRSIMQRRGLGRCVRAIDVQLRLRQLLTYKWPDDGFHPEHRIPVGRVPEVADAYKVRSIGEGRRGHLAGQSSVGTNAAIDVASRIVRPATRFQLRRSSGSDRSGTTPRFPVGQISIGHQLKLFAQCRRKQIAEVVLIAVGFQAVLEPLMAGMSQALQVGGFQHTQGLGAVLFNPPAELLLHHELVEQHNIRCQFTDEYVETAVVEFNGYFANTQRRGLPYVRRGRRDC